VVGVVRFRRTGYWFGTVVGFVGCVLGVRATAKRAGRLSGVEVDRLFFRLRRACFFGFVA
jgi:hypothetical protein